MAMLSYVLSLSSAAAELPEDEAPRKRRRRESTFNTSQSSSSLAGHTVHRRPHQSLYAPFRALGLVTNDIGFALEVRSFKGATEGPRVHVLTCLGRSWALWEGGRMTLLFVGPELPDPIQCMALHSNAVWVSSGPHVVKYVRGKETRRMTNPAGQNIASISFLGDFLLALTEDGKKMIIWSTESEEIISDIKFAPGFTATHILHPATYLNKVLVGSAQGSLQLWNIRTSTCIHKFSAESLREAADMNSPCAITSLVQSPALDVVGIGFSTGEVSLYDIRADERLMRIFMDGGSIRSLAFRSDGEPILATASYNGHIAMWDLNNKGRLVNIIRGAHDSSVNAIEWVPGQPLLISSGSDNSVKQWVSDSPTSLPRLLKFRSGHSKPPHLIRFYGEDGKQLLTASVDRSLRYTSVVRDSRSFELSQGHIVKKATALNIPLASLRFPPLSCLAFSTAKSKDWDDVLTCHGEEEAARTWSVREKKLGKWRLETNTPDEEKGKKRMTNVPPNPVKSLCVTACGNFGLIGSAKGTIHMYNMQSGVRRKTFRLTTEDMLENDKATVVTGLATDSLNRTVITSTQDGALHFFDFHSTKLEQYLPLCSSISLIVLNRDTNLLAIVCDDSVVRLIDIETRRVVREMAGFKGRVLDVAFSADARWLVATAVDCIIRTFDIPTGRLIDAFRTPSMATSLDFSPTNDFLATAHADSVGIYLWANRAQYADVSIQGMDEEDLHNIPLPSMQGETVQEVTAEGVGDESGGLDALASLTMEETPDVYATPPQLEGDLVTLTYLPRDRWKTLLNLEAIQQRNKPIEPPKAPEKVPFFIPTVPGLEPRFAIPEQAEETDKKKKKKSKKLKAGESQVESMFKAKLKSEDSESDYDDFFTYVKKLTPAATDLEIRSLSGQEEFTVFLNALTRRLKSHRDFEAVQTFLNVFLTIHGEELVMNPDMREALRIMHETQKTESKDIVNLITSSKSILGFLRGIF